MAAAFVPQTVSKVLWLAAVWAGLLGCFAVFAYGCGLYTNCPADGTFRNARFKGRMVLIHLPLTLVIVLMAIMGVFRWEWETVVSMLVACLMVLFMQIAWACGEIGILHGQIRRKGRTYGLAAVYSHERKRRWMRWLIPGRWAVLRLTLPGTNLMARRVRAQSVVL